jgi:iron complex outermembrane receptor protein
MQYSRKSAYLAGAAFTLLGGATAVNAQSMDAAGAQDIVVTAQRRAEKLEDVPMSISTVSAATVERAGLTNIDELGKVAPGVQVSHAGGSVVPSIRGITALTNTPGADSNVAIYVDGFYAPDTVSINADFANIESIEVLKGPQGALYGRNATGGAILVRTKAPSKVMTGKVEARYATFDDRTFSAYLSGPITDRVRFSLSGYDRASDGYMKLADPTRVGGTVGDAAPMRQKSYRAKIEADVTDAVTLTLGYNYGLSDDPRGNLFTTFAHIPPTVAAPPTRAVGYYDRSYNYDAVNKSTTNEATAKLVIRTPIGTLSSYTGYGHRKFDAFFDFDGTYADTGYSRQRYVQNTFQQTVDFAVDAIDKIDLVVGASYYRDDAQTRGPTHRTNYGPGLAVLNISRFKLKTDARAVYADATYKLTDALTLGVGGRYSEEEKTLNLDQLGTGAFPLLVRNATFKKFTPRGSIRYELAPRTNVYASYSQGFRSGSFPNAGTAASIAPIKPEVVKAYEIGFKTARSIFRFDVAAYYNDDRNLHVSILVPVCVGTACSVQSRVANAPKARSYGVDAQLSATPIDRFNIQLGGAYLNARYKDFPNASGTGVNATNDRNVTSQTQDWSNQQMARAPTWSGNLSADYTFPFVAGDLRLAGNLAYTDSFVINNASIYGPAAPASLAGKQRFRQKAYTLLNVQATWTDPSEHYSLGVFATNLTDVRYRITYSAGANGDYGTPGTPRQIGVRAGYQF